MWDTRVFFRIEKDSGREIRTRLITAWVGLTSGSSHPETVKRESYG
jgi:hypothetical protein